MKFTDEQKELLAILPKTLKNSKELTDSSKLVLSNIIFLYGIEEAQKNGFVYRTNTKMMEETGIKSEHTLIVAIRHLELLGIIETKRGKRKEASTYKLLKNCSETLKNCSKNCSEIETLQNQVLLLQKEIVLLQKEIENLKNCSKKCSTDTDKEIDIDKDKVPVDDVTEVTLHENNKIKNINIKTSDEVTLQDEEVNNDLKLNDMKKENEMSDNGTNAMNAISEQSERQARENESSESGTINKITTSTLGGKNIPVDKSKVINNDCNVQGVIPNAKDCAPAPATEEWKPIAWDEDAIFGLGEPKNVSDDKLSTNEEKTRQEAQKCPQNETDVFKRISEILEEALVITDVEPFKAKLQEAIDLLKQVRPSANINAFTRCCNDTIYWFKNNNFDDLDIFFAASDFKRNIEQMKRA